MNRAEYLRAGALVVRNVFAQAEMETLGAECERLLGLVSIIDTKNIRCRWANHVDTGECRFDCFDPVSDLSPDCARIARDARLLALLEELYGEPACLFKDKLIYKPAGAPGYPLHQDYIAWAEFPRSFTTAIVAIDPSNRENGATEVFLGQHDRGSLSPEDGQFHHLGIESVDTTRADLLELEPGDVAFMHGFTPHRSGANRSAAPRRLLYLSYNRASDGGDSYRSHYAQFHAWLREKYVEHGRRDVDYR